MPGSPHRYRWSARLRNPRPNRLEWFARHSSGLEDTVIRYSSGAISSSHGPGTTCRWVSTRRGSLPARAPRWRGVAHDDADQPGSGDLPAQYAAARMVRFARDDDRDAMLVRQPYGMFTTDARNLLSGSVRAVVQQACTGFRRDAAFRACVHIAALDLFHVIGSNCTPCESTPRRLAATSDSRPGAPWPAGRLRPRAARPTRK